MIHIHKNTPMRHQTTLFLLTAILITSSLLAACTNQTPAVVSAAESSPAGSNTETATLEPTQTLTPTLAPTSTPTIIPTPTSDWVFNPAGEVIAPILLYHHVAGESYEERYQVSIPDFQAQMQMLYDNGYEAITMSTLVDALLNGGSLPPKPVVITFDDGCQDVYDNAFPIMQEYGFPGVFYIVANRIFDVEDFVNIPELEDMIAAGWEIGSHSYTHMDIVADHSRSMEEIFKSKTVLETELNVPVNTFAYPFGKLDEYTANKVSGYGYRAGIGLGISNKHTLRSIYYIQRREVYGEYTLEEFENLLQVVN